MWKSNCLNIGCPFIGNNSISLRNHQRSCPFLINDGYKGDVIDYQERPNWKYNSDTNNYDDNGGENNYNNSDHDHNYNNNGVDNNYNNDGDQIQLTCNYDNDDVNNNMEEEHDNENDQFLGNSFVQTSIYEVLGTVKQKHTSIQEPLEITSEASKQARKDLCTSLAVSLLSVSRKSGAAMVNNVIDLLIDEDMNLDDIRRNIRSVKHCEKIVSTLVTENLESDGFEKMYVSDNSGKRCSLYKRSIVEVLRRQVGEVKRDHVFISPEEAKVFLKETHDDIEIHSHPMSCEMGNLGYNIIRNNVNQCNNENVIWFNESSETPSAPLLIQLYSDKSQTSLKSSNFQFYPIHAVSLNLTEEERKLAIVQGRTIIGYLPVTFYLDDTESSVNNVVNRFEVSSGLQREHRIGLLHKCLQIVTSEISEHYLTGIQVYTKDKCILNMHPAITSYVADIPEAKDILSVMHGNRSHRNCHRCLCFSSDFSKVGDHYPRTISHMSRIIDKYKDLNNRSLTYKSKSVQQSKVLKETSEKILSKFSIDGQPPALHNIPYVETPLSDPYKIFSFEPLHVLHLGITKMILSCLHARVKSCSTRPTIVLSKMNAFLREVHRLYKCQDLDVEFGSSAKSPALNGLFASDGLLGMLEAKDYKRIEKILPFLGAICDRALNEADSAPVTTVFTYYTTITMQIYRRGTNNYWTKEEVIKLKNNISKFKSLASSEFGSYQKSKMGTLKFHLLDHLIDDLYRAGSLSVCCGGLFEYSHIHSKRSFSSTSKRGHEALSSIVKRREEEMVLERLKIKKHSTVKYGKERPLSRSDGFVKAKSALTSMKSGIATTSKSSLEISLFSLDVFIAGRYEEIDSLEHLKILKNISNDVDKEGMEMMSNEIHSILQELNMGHHINVTLGFHCAAYVHSMATPESSNIIHTLTDATHVHMENNKKKFLYKLVCARDYHNAHGLRQDCIMLRNESCVCDGKICVCFASLKSIMTVKVWNSKGEEIFNNQFVFVNFFEVVGLRDKVDEKLGCIRLRWERAHRNEEIEHYSLKGNKREMLDPGKCFALTPIESIIGVLPVVPADGYDPYERYSGKTKYALGFHSKLPWFDQYFHINRFYSKADEKSK